MPCFLGFAVLTAQPDTQQGGTHGALQESVGATDASARARKPEVFGESSSEPETSLLSHPFMSTFRARRVTRAVSFVLTSFYNRVALHRPALLPRRSGAQPAEPLCAHGQHLRGDGVWQSELGSSEPYLKMLASIGVSADAAERTPTLVAKSDERSPPYGRRHAAACAASLRRNRRARRAIRIAWPERSSVSSVLRGTDRATDSDDAALLFAVTATLALDRRCR